jgi:hypothetical protein
MMLEPEEELYEAVQDLDPDAEGVEELLDLLLFLGFPI